MWYTGQNLHDAKNMLHPVCMSKNKLYISIDLDELLLALSVKAIPKFLNTRISLEVVYEICIAGKCLYF